MGFDAENVRKYLGSGEIVSSCLYKEMDDIQDCGNYQGIKLMSQTMKIWERVMERRIRDETSRLYERGSLGFS